MLVAWFWPPKVHQCVPHVAESDSGHVRESQNVVTTVCHWVSVIWCVQADEEIASGPNELESPFPRTGPRSGRARPCTPIPRRGSASNMLDPSTTQVRLCGISNDAMLLEVMRCCLYAPMLSCHCVCWVADAHCMLKHSYCQALQRLHTSTLQTCALCFYHAKLWLPLCMLPPTNMWSGYPSSLPCLCLGRQPCDQSHQRHSIKWNSRLWTTSWQQMEPN